MLSWSTILMRCCSSRPNERGRGCKVVSLLLPNRLAVSHEQPVTSRNKIASNTSLSAILRRWRPQQMHRLLVLRGVCRAL